MLDEIGGRVGVDVLGMELGEISKSLSVLHDSVS